VGIPYFAHPIGDERSNHKKPGSLRAVPIIPDFPGILPLIPPRAQSTRRCWQLCLRFLQRPLPSSLPHLLDVISSQQNGVQAEEGEWDIVRGPVVGQIAFRIDLEPPGACRPSMQSIRLRFPRFPEGVLILASHQERLSGHRRQAPTHAPESNSFLWVVSVTKTALKR
jgi:hypothetical protein